MDCHEHPAYNAAAYICVDGAWTAQTIVEITKRFGEVVDLHTIPGAAKNINAQGGDFVSVLIDNTIIVSMGLHLVPVIVIFSHWNCGAYGGNDAFSSYGMQLETYTSDLIKAARFLELEITRRLPRIINDENINPQVRQNLLSYEGNPPHIVCLAWSPQGVVEVQY